RSSPTSLRTAAAAIAGSYLSSSTIRRMRRPFMPPAAFASSTPMRNPLRVACPQGASGPLKSRCVPTMRSWLITPWAACARVTRTAITAAMASTTMAHSHARRGSRGLSGGEYKVTEALAQCDLLNFARGRVRDFAHEHDVVRYPPLGDLAGEKRQYVVARGP